MSYDHDDLPGHGRQAGPLRTEWGDGWAELKCDRCGAGWTGPIGEECGWCAKLIVDVGGTLDTADDYDSAAYDALAAEVGVDDPFFQLHDVTFDDFADVDEDGAEPIVGTADDIVIPAGGDVMFYGTGGAGKTTLGNDLACHLAAGCDWLGLSIPTTCRVYLVENEGPRPQFRKKLRRKRNAWRDAERGDLNSRLHVVDEPWGQLNLSRETHRAALAQRIRDLEIDVVIIGPLAASGMLGPGTPQEVREFLAFCADVRRRAGRPVTFIVIHHENKGGKVSGAWEGAGDTLIHVTGKGNGQVRLYVQKARWSSTWHARTLELRWTDGEGFEIDDRPEVSDDDIAERVLGESGNDPGVGASKVEKAITGVGNDRIRRIRDRLLAEGRIVNVIRRNGIAIALDHIEPKREAHLYLADDPIARQALPQLRQNPGADGA